MTDKYNRDPKQDSIGTRVIDADSGADADRSLDHKLATGETIAVTPRPGYVRHSRPDLSTTARLAYRRTTGFCRTYSEECGAVAAGIILLAGGIAALVYTSRCNDRDESAERKDAYELRLGGSEEDDQFYQQYVKESGIDKIYPAKSKASKMGGKANKVPKKEGKSTKKPVKKWLLKKR